MEVPLLDLLVPAVGGIDRREGAAPAVVRINGRLTVVQNATMRPGVRVLESMVFVPVADLVHEFA